MKTPNKAINKAILGAAQELVRDHDWNLTDEGCYDMPTKIGEIKTFASVIRKHIKPLLKEGA